jgi:quinol monooxygenase YgiN
VTLLLALPAQAQDKEPDVITRLKKAKVNGPFLLVVHVQVKKGEEKAFQEAAKPCVEATRKEKGCVAYDVHQDAEDSTKFVFVEKWKSVKDLEGHFKEEHLQKFVGKLHDMVAGEPKFAFYAEKK